MVLIPWCDRKAATLCKAVSFDANEFCPIFSRNRTQTNKCIHEKLLMHFHIERVLVATTILTLPKVMNFRDTWSNWCQCSPTDWLALFLQQWSFLKHLDVSSLPYGFLIVLRLFQSYSVVCISWAVLLFRRLFEVSEPRVAEWKTNDTVP